MINWRRNLTVAWIAQLVCILGFNSVWAFLPFYLQEMGVSDLDHVKLWTGWITTGGSVSMAIFAPIWGSLADRYGRKIMVVRAALGGTVIMALMAFATTPAQFLILRIIQGTLTGTVSAFTTLVAACTPRGKEGFSLGMMQVAVYSGSSAGPLMGGFLADAFGYRTTFLVSSVILLIGGLLTVLLFQESFVPATRKRVSVWQSTKEMTRDSNILSMVIVILALYTTGSIVSPILPIFVQSLTSDQARLATITGSITGVTALVSAVSAAIAGRLADRIGHERILVAACVGAAIAYLPMTLVQTPMQLLALNVLVGVFIGGLMPTTNALIALRVPREKQGATYGLMASSGAAGRAIGPMIGSGIAVGLGNRALFPVATAMYGVLSVAMALQFRKTGASHAQAEPAEERERP